MPVPTEIERIAAIESDLKHFAGQMAAQATQLTVIASSTQRSETLLEYIAGQLRKGDETFDEIDRRLDELRQLLAEHDHAIKDLKGGGVWPSFVDLQKAHIDQREREKNGPTFSELQQAHVKQRTLFWAFGSLWTLMTAAVAAFATWAGLPFWHGKP